MGTRPSSKAPMAGPAPPQASAPGSGPGGGGSGLPAPITSWKCAHCTYLNHSPAILDPQSKNHKGFCEICEGVTTLA
eukprot:1430916-Prymnesium_polylepis.2